METKLFAGSHGHSLFRGRHALTCIISVALICGMANRAAAQAGILLDCSRYDGKQDFQIYIDEADGYVLYNAQLRNGSLQRSRDYAVADGADGEAITLDDSLTIWMNNEVAIHAHDDSSSFIYIKASATFAYAWTMLVPLSGGSFNAFSNHHDGECSPNPFVQGRKLGKGRPD